MSIVRNLVANDLTRAGAFFALTVSVAVVGSLLLGDVTLGLEVGVPLGLAIAVFAYLFVRPTSEDDSP